MSDSAFKETIIIGSSIISSRDAVRHAMTRANVTLDAINWYEVVDSRDFKENGEVVRYEATVKIGSRVG
ncbi:dodecin domain-containing protein [Pontibacterium sp.]|uniref:dodecin domain-containing protein n=1 Tax=Pontibacterium sp. TaxID=2036026 RepID=UPI003515B83F